MTKFKCQLCNQIFSSGTTFVGHINAHHHHHHASRPSSLLPPKPIRKHQQLGRDSAESSSSSHSPCVEKQREKKKFKNLEVGKVKKPSLVYGLRANPKKSIKISDPDFSSAAAIDKAGENDSKTPIGRRSKRARKSSFGKNQEQNFNVNPSCSVELPAAGTELLSWVSDDAVSEVVQAGTALMMMSRDVRPRRTDEEQDGERSVELRQNNVKFQCQKCNKQFQSSRALAGHKKSCPAKRLKARNSDKQSIFECPYCSRVFGSGQALGGHKRSHLVNSPRTDSSAVTENSAKRGSNLIDLNLPARSDDDELSAVCDA